MDKDNNGLDLQDAGSRKQSNETREVFKREYQDTRKKSKIAVHWCDQLVAFRGFGPLKNVYKNKTLIGRIRVSDLRDFDNDMIADNQTVTNYNPSRLL